MKVGDLIQHRGVLHRGEEDEWGLGIIVDQCEAGACEAQVSVQHHWVIHFPNRRHKGSMAEFVHSSVSQGVDKDNLKWLVME